MTGPARPAPQGPARRAPQNFAEAYVNFRAGLSHFTRQFNGYLSGEFRRRTRPARDFVNERVVEPVTRRVRAVREHAGAVRNWALQGATALGDRIGRGGEFFRNLNQDADAQHPRPGATRDERRGFYERRQRERRAADPTDRESRPYGHAGGPQNERYDPRAM